MTKCSRAKGRVQKNMITHKIYMMTPRDHMSQDLSYFSGPSTSGAREKKNKMQSYSVHMLLRYIKRERLRGKEKV